MKIGLSIGRGDAVEELHITAEGDEDLTALKNFLEGHQWVKLDENGKLINASIYRDTPEPEYDKDIGQIWKEGPVELRRKSKKGDDDRSFYVQHLGGYSGDRKKKAQRMVVAGFSVLRSRRGTDGLIWEVWYLPGAWAAKGEIRGKDEKQILDWLRHEIAPGQIDLSGGSWGLRYPED